MSDTVYEKEPHESPSSMTIPLIILAIFSATAGLIPFGEFVSADKAPLAAHLNYPLAAIAVVVGVVGIGLAWLFYKKASDLPEKWASSLGKAYTWAYDKFYIDEVYLFITRKILFKRVAEPAAKFDRKIVDGTMVGIGDGTVGTSRSIKGIQSGKVQDYAMAFVAGILVLVLVFIYFWTD